MAATASNEHIAKIAALPRGIRFCVFLQPLLALIKCWEAATSAICHHVSRHPWTAQWKLAADRKKRRLKINHKEKMCKFAIQI